MDFKSAGINPGKNYSDFFFLVESGEVQAVRVIGEMY